MAILTVPGSEVQIATPSPAVKLDAGALTAPALAAGAAAGTRYRGAREVAAGVQSVGDAFGAIGEHLEKVDRARVAAEASFRMRAAHQSFVESLKGDPDENEWGARAKDTFERVRGEILDSGGIPNGMRSEMDSAVKNWGQTLQIEAGTLAAVQKVNRAEIAVRKDYDDALRSGDGYGAAKAVALGRASRLDPAQMDRLEDGIGRGLAETAIENGLRTNPVKTLELLQSGAALPIVDHKGEEIVPTKVFTARELESRIVSARRDASSWQSANYQDLLTKADPITGLIDEGAINQAVADKDVSPRAGKALIDSQNRQVAAERRAQFNLLKSEIHDPALWADEPGQTFEELKAKAEAIPDATLRGQALNDLQRTYRGVRKVGDADASKLILARAHDPTGWESAPDEYAATLVESTADIGNPTLRRQTISEINQQLASWKKRAQLAVGPVESDVLAQLRDDMNLQTAMVPLQIVDVGAKTGFLGFGAKTPARTEFKAVAGGLKAIHEMGDKDVEATFGKGATKESVVQAVQIHRAELEHQLREWFKTPEGQKATIAQAEARRQEIERPWVLESARASLSSHAPASISTESEYKSLPPGARFVWRYKDGREAVGVKP